MRKDGNKLTGEEATELWFLFLFFSEAYDSQCV